jgi:acyl carrier protein
MAERPELMRRMLQELMALFRKGQLSPLPYRAFPAANAAEAFRHMQQSRHIGKVVLSFDPPPAAPRLPVRRAAKLALRPDATYLVTGGLRGFGLSTAKWLASRGAKHLVLAGRTGAADEAARAALAELQAAGVRVEAACCDVSDRASLVALLARMRVTLPPLRGIIHAAALIEDGLIRDLTAERIAAVLGPKARGAAHLDELTRDCELDFFVLYSSVATLFGNPGQASYVAANRSLEVLAAARRAQGLAALCLGFGPIGDAGYLTRHRAIREALEARLGGSALSAAEALAALERAMLSDSCALTVVRFDRGAPRLLAGTAAPKYAPLLARLERGDAVAAAGDEIQRWLEELNDEELTALFVEMVTKEIASILRMSPEKLEAGAPLQDLGLDSLMGVELMTAVEARFGVNIPAMAMSEVGTIERLAKRIVRELRGRTNESAPREEQVLAEQVRVLAAQHASEMDPERVEAFAAEFKASVK